MATEQNIDRNSDEYYYTNPSEWGRDQFITLDNVIDNILITADDDSYFKHCTRFRASIFGKQGMKRLNMDLKQINKAIAIQLSPSRTFPYPRFMNHWNKISVLNECDKLTTLNVNNSPLIHDYLQDHQWELLYDHEGNVLEANSFNAETGECNRFQCVPVTDPCSKTFTDSWVKDNKEGGYFEFSEDLVDQIIVIEFQTTGLDKMDNCDIKIPHVLELAIENWIRFNLLKGKRNVPANEWKAYWEFYRLEKRRARPFLSKKITYEQILKSINLR